MKMMISLLSHFFSSKQSSSSSSSSASFCRLERLDGLLDDVTGLVDLLLVDDLGEEEEVWTGIKLVVKHAC